MPGLRWFHGCVVVLVSAMLACGGAVAPGERDVRSSAARGGSGGGGGGGGGGGRPPPETESGVNNVSFPILFSDDVSPAGFPADAPWAFAAVTDPLTQCVQETNTTTPVPTTFSCYFGRHTTTVSETGEIAFDGDAKVWWLQKRQPTNFWKAFSIGYKTAAAARTDGGDTDPTLVVSAVDVGDLLESSPSIAARQIRTEFNLLQNVTADDPVLGAFVVPDFTAIPEGAVLPAPCNVPVVPKPSLGCFAALGMSGAVPPTQQTINEIQGVDFGPATGTYPGTRALRDPASIRGALPADGSAAIPVQAIVYSRCARLLIQRVAPTATWDAGNGIWSGDYAPVVNVAAYDGDAYAAEINSGGGVVYGYNWNASTVSVPATYRLTFVLDGPTRCTVPLRTKFAAPNPEDPTAPHTHLVNIGEANRPVILFAGDPAIGDEGGIVYIDLILTAKGGGSRR